MNLLEEQYDCTHTLHVPILYTQPRRPSPHPSIRPHSLQSLGTPILSPCPLCILIEDYALGPCR